MSNRSFKPRGNNDGYRRAGQLFDMTPEMGELCNNLAKVAHAAKNIQDAISLYDRALQWRRTEYGPFDPRCAATLHNIGRAFMDLKEYGAAENALTEACAIYDKVCGEKKDMRYAESLSLLALSYTQLKFLPEAEQAFEESMEVFKKLCYCENNSSWIPEGVEPPKDPQLHPLSGVAHCLADQSKLLVMLRKEEQALFVLNEALAIRRYLYTNHHKFKPIIAQTLGKVSEIKRHLRDGSGASDAIDEAIDISIETLGRESPQTAQLISSKGMLLCAMMRFREARKLFEESITTFAVTLGKQSSAYGDELIKLARCLMQLNEAIQAEKMFVSGIEVLTASVGKTHPATLEAMAFLASLLVGMSEVTKAVEIFTEVAQTRKSLNPEDPALAGIYHKLADAMTKKNDPQAEVYFLLSLERHKANANGDAQHLLFSTDVMDDLGLFYAEFKHFDKAQNCFQEALDKRIKQLGEKNLTVAYSYSNLSLVNLYKENHEECEKYAIMALKIYKEWPGEIDQRSLSDVHSTLGASYYQQSRLNEAILYFDKSLNVRRKLGDQASLGTVENMVQLGRVYVRQEQWQKAHSILAEAKAIASKSPRMMEPLLREISATEQLIPPKQVWASELLDAKLGK